MHDSSFPFQPLSHRSSQEDRWSRFFVIFIGAATLLAVFAVCLFAVRALLPLFSSAAHSFHSEALSTPLIAALIQTAVLTLLLILLFIPLGVAAAIYLHEYTSPQPWSRILSLAIRTVAGVPSILLGVLGLIFFARTAGLPLNRILTAEETLLITTPATTGIFAVAVALALLALPAVIVAGQRAIASVPDTLREGSYACGASDGQTLRYIILPHAWPGIFTGALLSLARGLGEVTPLLFVAALRAGLF